MSKKYCPQCGKQLTDNARFCLHCGSEVPQIGEDTNKGTNDSADTVVSNDSPHVTNEEKPLSESEETTVTLLPSNKRKSPQNKKKGKWPIGYLIFLAIILLILIWLIRKKANAVAPPPMHSLPSERPYRSNIISIDSLDTILVDTLYDEDLMLSPSLPHISFQTPAPPPPLENNDYSYDDYYDDPPVSSYTEPTNEVRPSTSLQFNTEQSVRNMLVSNRFVDPLTSDVLTFKNNGNVLLKNGDTIAVDMEVSKLTTYSAVLDYYDNNKSWDIQLDINGQRKKLSWMDNTYIAD